MEKQEKCYYLNDIIWLCYIDENAKGKAIPFVYSESKSAIKNLNTNEIIRGSFHKAEPEYIAEKLGIQNPTLCTVIRGNTVVYSIIAETPTMFLSSEVKDCVYYIPYNGRHIEETNVNRYAKRKLMTSKDLAKYSRKIAKIHEKNNKDIVRNVKNNCVEDTRYF